MRLLWTFVALAAALSAPSQGRATVYVEYNVTGYGLIQFFDVNSPPFPYLVDEYGTITLRTLAAYNDPDYGSGIIDYSGPSYAFASSSGSYLSISQSVSMTGVYGSIGATICFDHDLGGALPTSAAGFVAGCGAIGGWTPHHYSGYYLDAPVTGFSARVIEGPDVIINGGVFELGMFPGVGSPLPEPSTWAMMLVGFGLIGAMIRKRTANMHPEIGIPT